MTTAHDTDARFLSNALRGNHGEDEMALTREEAWEHLCSWTETHSLRNHARAVELVMRAAALRYGEGDADVEQWGIAGMLHDADYERWPEDHPMRIVRWLWNRHEEALAHAVSAHYTKWGVPHESTLDKALIACDELTGFIGACCLVRPEGVSTLTPKSVKKKLKDKRFAASVERSEVQAGVDILGVDLTEHIQFIIDALKPHAQELGLQGRPQ
jgi:predicted hydrolase (HD superfamily)